MIIIIISKSVAHCVCQYSLFNLKQILNYILLFPPSVAFLVIVVFKLNYSLSLLQDSAFSRTQLLSDIQKEIRKGLFPHAHTSFPKN
jgi:hypothetical protein